MSSLQESVNYQFKVVLAGINPMIWRRLLGRNDTKFGSHRGAIQIPKPLLVNR